MAKKSLSILLSVLLLLTAVPMAMLPVLSEVAPSQTPVTYELELDSYEVLQYTDYNSRTWNPRVYQVENGVRTEVLPTPDVYMKTYAPDGAEQYDMIDTSKRGVHKIECTAHINNSYVKLPDLEIEVVPNTFVLELDTANFISTVEQYYSYNIYNTGLRVKKVTDSGSTIYSQYVYCNGYVDTSAPGDYAIEPYIFYIAPGYSLQVNFAPVTVTVTPSTLDLDILSYRNTVEQYGCYDLSSWAPSYSVTHGGGRFDESYSVSFYSFAPNGDKVHYLNTAEAGEHTIYAYIYFNEFEIDVQPLTVTVNPSPAAFALDITNVNTGIAQYAPFSLNDAAVTMTRGDETTALTNRIYTDVTDPNGNSGSFVNAAIPGEHTVNPYIIYNNNRIDFDPFTVTVADDGITFGIDPSSMNSTILQYAFMSFNLETNIFPTITVNGETARLNTPVYGSASVNTNLPGEYTVRSYIYYDANGGTAYKVELPEVTVTVLPAAEHAQALTLGGTAAAEDVPEFQRAVFRFTPAVSDTYTFKITGVFDYGYAYLFDANNNYCGYEFVDGNNNTLTASLTADKTYVVYVDCSGIAPYTVNVELGHTHQLTALAAADPTCTEPGNVACEYCAGCGKYFTDDTATEELPADQAVIPATNHVNAEHHGANDATCAADGNIEYWYCPDCLSYFSDAQFTAKISAKDTVLPSTPHFFGEPVWHWDEIEYSAATAVFTCTGCGIVYIGLDDTIDTVEVSAATCTADQVVKYVAYVEFNEVTYTKESEAFTVPNTAGHRLVTREAKAPTCTEVGWDAYQSCERCDYSTYVELPPAGHTLINHEAKAPTCTEIGWYAYETCEKCDYTTYVELPPAHTLVDHEAKAPTCAEVGWNAYRTCEKCDYTTYAQLPATGEHTAEVVNASPATDTEDGYTGDTVCAVCGAMLAQGEVIPATGAPETPAEPGAEEVEPCHQCGEYHDPKTFTGFFTGMLHDLIYIIKRLISYFSYEIFVN